MNISKRIKDILYQQNLTLTQLNDLLNERKGTNHTVQNLSRKLISDSLKYSDVEDILDVLGYSLEIVSNKHLENIAINKTNIQAGGDDISDLLECDEHEEVEISDLFQGGLNFKKMVREELEKQIRKIITSQTNSLIKEVLLSDPYSYNAEDKNTNTPNKDKE